MIKPKRHPDRLIPSDKDMVSLCAAVVTNYNMLLKSHQRIKGTDLVVPTDFESTRVRVAVLASRYSKDDFRHSESEKRALRVLAQWTLEINHSLRNQEGSPQILQWVD